MEGISIKLPESLRRKLAAEAKRRQVTQSVIVRESIEHTLGRSPGGSLALSCADLVRSLIGRVHSGRNDLATNKELLAGAMLESAERAPQRRR